MFALLQQNVKAVANSSVYSNAARNTALANNNNAVFKARGKKALILHCVRFHTGRER